MRVLIFGGDSDIARAVEGSILITHKECDVVSEKKVNLILDRFKPNVVINCAGISHVGLVKDQELNLWLEQISVNLIGSYVVAKACAKRNIMVILIGSVAGLYGKAEHSAYCASKAGVISLVQSLGMEGHKAYCISPGRVNTKMREHDYPGEDVRTRLDTREIAKVIQDCIRGKYKLGDNIIVRKRGFRKLKRVDQGAPWKSYLNVQPRWYHKKI